MNIDLTNFQLGVENFNNKRYSIAIQNMNEYINEPCLIYGDKANLIKGFSNYFLNNFDEAINLISNALFDPEIENDYQTFYYRGLCYSKLNQFTLAESDFLKSIELNQFFASSRIWLYFLYKSFNEEDKAKITLHKLIDDNSGNFDALVKQSLLLYDDNYLELFLKISNDLNENKPNEPNILQNRAFCNLALKLNNEAISDMNKVIQIISAKAEGKTLGVAHYHRGKVLHHAGLTEQAKIDFQIALDLGVEEARSEI